MAVTTTNKRANHRRPSADIEPIIFQTALKLAGDGGLAAVSMEELTRQTGVAKTTLYRRWPNKSLLLLDAVLQAVNAEVRPLPAAEATLPFEAKLVHLISKACVFFRSPLGEVVAQLIGAAQADPELLAALQARYLESRRQQIRNFLQEASARGEIVPASDWEFATDAIAGPIYFRLLMRHEPLSDEFASSLSHLVAATLTVPSRG